MTPEDQRFAIAEECGWKTQRESWPTGERITWLAPYEVPGYLGRYTPPDYLNDLNAMHEAVKTLDAEAYARFCGRLILAFRGRELLPYLSLEDSMAAYAMSAEAHEIAEAFLKTLGKWKTAGSELEK